MNKLYHLSKSETGQTNTYNYRTGGKTKDPS